MIESFFRSSRSSCCDSSWRRMLPLSLASSAPAAVVVLFRVDCVWTGYSVTPFPLTFPFIKGGRGRTDVLVNNRSPRGHDEPNHSFANCDANSLGTFTSNESFCWHHPYASTYLVSSRSSALSSLFPIPHVPRESVRPAKCHESPAASLSVVGCCCCFVPIDVSHSVPQSDLG